MTFCCSDIEGSARAVGAAPGGDGRGARAPRRADRRRRRGARRQPDQVDGRGRLDRLGVRLGDPAAIEAALAANRALDRRGMAAGHPHRRRAGASTPARPSARRRLLRPERQPRRARARAGRRRPDPALLGDRELVAGASARGLLARRPRPAPPHRGSARRERIHALAGPGVDAPPSATSARTAACSRSSPATRASSSAARRSWRRPRRAGVARGELLAVVGASGSGKSSVLRAGVVAAVARRRGRRASSDAVAGDAGRRAPRSTCPTSRTTLLVVDQFEELFTLCDDAGAARAFVDALLRPARRASRSACAPTSTGGSARTRALAHAVAANQVLLGAMTRRRARARGRRSRRGSPGLQARARPGRADPARRRRRARRAAAALARAARDLGAPRRAARSPSSGYRESGGVASAIARTADARRRRAARRAARARARRVPAHDRARRGHRGLPPARGRRRARAGGRDAADAVDALLERLAEARLVTLGDGSAEVAHEALIREWPRLRRLARGGPRGHPRAPAARRRRAAVGRRRPRAVRPLPRRPARGRGRARRGRRAELNATERAFLDAGVEESERERRAERRTNRRLRGLLGGAAVLLVVAVAAGALSLAQREQAQEAEGPPRRRRCALGRRARRRARASPPRGSSSRCSGRRRRRAGGPARDAGRPARRAAAQPGGPRDPRHRAREHHRDGGRRPTQACWSRRRRGRGGADNRHADVGAGRRDDAAPGRGRARSRWRSRPTAGASRSACRWPTATRCTSST